jgi:hypothetical protein
MPDRFRVLVLKYPTQRLTELKSKEFDELKHLTTALNSDVRKDEAIVQMAATIVGNSLVYTVLLETMTKSFSYFTKDQKRG